MMQDILSRPNGNVPKLVNGAVWRITILIHFVNLDIIQRIYVDIFVNIRCRAPHGARGCKHKLTNYAICAIIIDILGKYTLLGGTRWRTNLN